MFLDHEQRPVPPRWEPPGRKDAGRRGENAAITLILLISLLGFVTPVAGGTLVAMLMAIFGR